MLNNCTERVDLDLVLLDGLVGHPLVAMHGELDLPQHGLVPAKGLDGHGTAHLHVHLPALPIHVVAELRVVEGLVSVAPHLALLVGGLVHAVLVDSLVEHLPAQPVRVAAGVVLLNGDNLGLHQEILALQINSMSCYPPLSIISDFNTIAPRPLKGAVVEKKNSQLL